MQCNYFQLFNVFNNLYCNKQKKQAVRFFWPTARFSSARSWYLLLERKLQTKMIRLLRITIYLNCMDGAFFDHFNKFEWDLFLVMFVIWRKSKNEFNPKWNMFDPFISRNWESITNIQN